MCYQELFLENPAARKLAVEESLALYETIIEIESLNASAAFNQGLICLEYLSGYSEAEYWFSQAIEALPYYHQAFYNRGLARESLDNLLMPWKIMKWLLSLSLTILLLLLQKAEG